jgi:hypothetical protein
MRENSLISEIYHNYFRQLIQDDMLTSTDANFAHVKDPIDFVWYFLTSSFYFDKPLIDMMQYIFNYQTIVVSLVGNRFAVSCEVPVNYNFPDNFIMVLNTSDHYVLITYDNKAIFTFATLPSSMKIMFRNNCVYSIEPGPRTVGSFDASAFTEIFGHFLRKEKDFVFALNERNEDNAELLDNYRDTSDFSQESNDFSYFSQNTNDSLFESAEVKPFSKANVEKHSTLTSGKSKSLTKSNDISTGSDKSFSSGQNSSTYKRNSIN